MAITIDTVKLVREGRWRGATFIALFGSHACGDQRLKSNVDVLARFSDRKSLLDLISIESAFSESIGRKVDLVTEGSLDPLVRESIAREEWVRRADMVCRHPGKHTGLNPGDNYIFSAGTKNHFRSGVSLFWRGHSGL